MGTSTIARDLATLLELPGVGPSRARKLLPGRDGGDWLESESLHSALKPNQRDELPRARARVDAAWLQMEAAGVRAISICDPEYPAPMRDLLGTAAPVVLYCLGALALLGAPSVGFCGSRKASEKGMAAAADAAGLLAAAGVNVVSGFASGIDMHAHLAALAAGGTTTVALAEGIGGFRVKQEIANQWDEKRTLVVSEFPPSAPWSVGRAMQRNRTICGLSRALILIEARATGGSFAAGRECLELGLPLFAAVYEGMPEAASGNLQLLGEGARGLMRSRRTGRSNIAPVLAAVRSAPAS